MNKCPNCGTEFEGKFCSECGTPWQEEKTCPHCGTQLSGGAKFCNQCGFSFIGNTAPLSHPAAQSETATAAVNAVKAPFLTDTRKRFLFRLFGFLPAALFALFSALLFALFAAPVAAAILGEGMGSESLGNVYQMLGYSEIPSLQNGMIALIVFAVFSLANGILIVVSLLHPQLKFRQVTLFKKLNVTVTELLTYCGYAFYFVYFIVGCTAIGEINAADGGMGAFGAGACPILLIVFTILFALFSAGAAVGRFLIGKNCPELAAESRENKAVWNRERAEKIAAEKAALTPPVPPQAPAKINKPTKKSIPKPEGLLKEVIALRRKKRLIACFCFFILPLVIAMPRTKHMKKWSLRQARGKVGTIFVVLFSIFAMLVVLGFMTWLIISRIQMNNKYGDSTSFADIGSYLTFLILVVYYLGIFIAALVALKKQKNLCIAFYGTKKPEKNAARTFLDMGAQGFSFRFNRHSDCRYRAFLRARFRSAAHSSR